MTPAERLDTLRALDQILRDNTGNRITPALIVGVVNTMHDHMPVELQPPKDTDPPLPTGD